MKNNGKIKDSIRTYDPFGMKFMKKQENDYIAKGEWKPQILKSSYVHKGTDEVKPYGYNRDILFGSGKYYSTGRLKDL